MLKYIMILWIIFASMAAVSKQRDPIGGPHPYSFPDRNAQTSLVIHESKRKQGDARSLAAGLGYEGFGVIINNTTISAGNWQEIEMTLGDGSEGTITSDSLQDNNGNAQSSSTISHQTESASDATE